MRRLVLLGFLALGIVTTLMLGLVAAPPVTAAQKVAATLYNEDTYDLQLRVFFEPRGRVHASVGLEISFTGADNERQSVRVYLPAGYARLARLPVRFDDPSEATRDACPLCPRFH